MGSSSCLSGAPAEDRQVHGGNSEVHDGAHGEGHEERRTDDSEDDLNHVGHAGHEAPENAGRLYNEGGEVRSLQQHGRRGGQEQHDGEHGPQQPRPDGPGRERHRHAPTDRPVLLEIQRAEGGVELQLPLVQAPAGLASPQMLPNLALSFRSYGAVGELEDGFGVAPTGEAHSLSPASSSLPASMLRARKSRLFTAGTEMERTSAISA